MCIRDRVISFSAVTNPSSPSYSYSSGIPHYTQASGNAFTYVLTVTNASGNMYSNNTFLTQDNNSGSAFQNSGSKNYTNFAGGTNPPTRNYGVGTGVTTLITSIPRDLHTTITSNHFTRYDVRLINASSPDGYNLAKLTHGSATTNSVYWYEDPSTVSAPVISFSGVTTPASQTVAYSSGICLLYTSPSPRDRG